MWCRALGLLAPFAALAAFHPNLHGAWEFVWDDTESLGSLGSNPGVKVLALNTVTWSCLSTPDPPTATACARPSLATKREALASPDPRSASFSPTAVLQ